MAREHLSGGAALIATAPVPIEALFRVLASARAVVRRRLAKTLPTDRAVAAHWLATDEGPRLQAAREGRGCLIALARVRRSARARCRRARPRAGRLVGSSPAGG